MKNNDLELPSGKVDILGNSYITFIHTSHGNSPNSEKVRTERNWQGQTLTGDPSLQESPPSGSKHCRPIQKGRDDVDFFLECEKMYHGRSRCMWLALLNFAMGR